VFIRTQTNGSRTYLLLVENERIGGRLVQRVLHRLVVVTAIVVGVIGRGVLRSHRPEGSRRP